MPQNPLAATVATNPAGQQAPAKLNTAGELLVSALPALTLLDITAATVVKAGAGRAGTLSVVVGGTGAGGIYDSLTTASLTAANQLAVIPTLTTAQISTLKVDMPFTNGLVVSPGTGQTVAVSYE
jgi:hypothetical protein